MTDLLTNTQLRRLWLTVFLLPSPALAQITQDRPELCGKPNTSIPLPPNVSATSSDVEANLVLRLKGSDVNIRMDGVDQVQQVCPIGGNRLLVFGLLGDHSAHAVYVIDAVSGAKLDAFWVRSPAVSPDQHWLAAREFYPAQADINITEQYRLYDLTKDAAGNRIPGVDYSYVQPLGRTVYPATSKHIPFESTGVAPEQVHNFEGGSFHWSPDSKWLLFMDRTTDGLAVVVVRVGSEDLTTYLHRWGTEGCAAPISQVVWGAALGRSVRDLHIQFGSACSPLNLHPRNFKLADVEVYKPKPRMPPILRKQ